MSPANESTWAHKPSPAGHEPVDQFLRHLVVRYREKEAEQSAKSPAFLVQDYTPLVNCLESELAGTYWRTVGIHAFAGNEVPFIINNDGRLSRDAAAVFYANCLETGAPEPQIRILEFGAGTGLFALFFLDAFQQICAAEGKDFYDRLVYCVSDGSARTVEQWRLFEQFARHSGHVHLGRCDARDPSRLFVSDDEVIEIEGPRAIFANYILDVLPAAVVRSENGRPQQLCVRTMLEDEADVTRFDSEFDAQTVRRLAESADPEDRVKLLPLLDALQFDTAFVDVAGDPPPYLHEALQFGKGMDRILLNFGAIECLQSCLRMLREDGFIQINDYGPAKEEEVARFGTATRFGSSIAMGVNFPLLEHYFAGKAHVVTPSGDEKRSIHSRTFTRTALDQTRSAYLYHFGEERWQWDNANNPLTQGRKAMLTGKSAEGLEFFRQALEDNPGNWCVIGEAAEFLIRHGDPQNGTELLKLAIDRNPWYSSWLWNTLGDGLWAMDLYREAQSAYEQAARVNPVDVAANFNLSFVYSRVGRHREALEALSKALIHDFQGEYRERILDHQQQIMRALSTRWMMQQIRRSQRAAAFE